MAASKLLSFQLKCCKVDLVPHYISSYPHTGKPLLDSSFVQRQVFPKAIVTIVMYFGELRAGVSWCSQCPEALSADLSHCCVYSATTISTSVVKASLSAVLGRCDPSTASKSQRPKPVEDRMLQLTFCVPGVCPQTRTPSHPTWAHLWLPCNRTHVNR